MIGMTFPTFLTLLFIGFISSIVLHAFVGYRVLPGFDGFLSKWAVAWIGAWLGSPVLGHWGGYIAGVYIVPALLGAFVGPFLATAGLRALNTVAKSARPEAMTAQMGASSRVEMKKAS
jgi:uncharacterized membrane protein YeaQ/YmgE (transglycosylase-associated protein family)